jgi:hypothetical protein
MMSRRGRTIHRATIGLAALLAIAVQAATVTGAASDVELKQTTGTVHAVDPDARRISVITGCGHALRVKAFHVGTACRIEVEGVVVPLTDLRRGQIVSVRYRGDAEPYEAETIATVPASNVEGKR